MGKREAWVDTYPELTTRENLLDFMVVNDQYATVIMQCLTTILEGPHYLRGYQMGHWCLNQVLEHNLVRAENAFKRVELKAPELKRLRISNEAVGVLKNAWKNASNAMGRNSQVVFTEHDHERDKTLADPHRNIRTRRLLVKFPNCVYCNVVLTAHNATIDHAIPRSKGGGADGGHMNNILSCGDCNNKKGSQIWDPVHVTELVRTSHEYRKLLERIASIRVARERLKGGL